jgi:hypothetical protein
LDSSGTSRSITLQYSTFTINYPYTESNVLCNWFSFSPRAVPLLTSLTLANGLSYSLSVRH